MPGHAGGCAEQNFSELRPTPRLYRYFTVKPLNANFFISTGSLLLYLFISTGFKKYCSDFIVIASLVVHLLRN